MSAMAVCINMSLPFLSHHEITDRGIGKYKKNNEILKTVFAFNRHPDFNSH